MTSPLTTSQGAQDRCGFGNGDLELSEGGANADVTLLELEARNIAAAIARGDLLASWALGVEAVTRCLRLKGHE